MGVADQSVPTTKANDRKVLWCGRGESSLDEQTRKEVLKVKMELSDLVYCEAVMEKLHTLLGDNQINCKSELEMKETYQLMAWKSELSSTIQTSMLTSEGFGAYTQIFLETLTSATSANSTNISDKKIFINGFLISMT